MTRIGDGAVVELASKDRDQEISVWLAPAFCVLVAAGISLAGFVPAVSPGMSADAVAAYYAANAPTIRAGLLVFNVCGALIVPFYVTIMLQMKRMRLSSQALPYTYLICLAAGAGLYVVADMVWLIAVFRPDRSPQALQLLSDLGWIGFTAPVGTWVTMMLVLALATFLDNRVAGEPVYPRWVGTFNIVAAMLVFPAVLSAVYRTGPLAWDGAISYWLRLSVIVIYIAVMFVAVQNARRSQQQVDRKEVLA
jgi:hypothetical protein